jgi:hypothetical protein
MYRITIRWQGADHFLVPCRDTSAAARRSACFAGIHRSQRQLYGNLDRGERFLQLLHDPSAGGLVVSGYLCRRIHVVLRYTVELS